MRFALPEGLSGKAAPGLPVQVFLPALAKSFPGQIESIAPEVDFVVAGHTHLARSLPRKKGEGFYFNSGTWIRLIRLTDPVIGES